MAVPVFFVLLTVALLITLVPLLFLALATLMTRFGYFDIPNPWTFVHWGHVLHDSVFLASFKNTLVLAGATAAISVVVIYAYCLRRHSDSFRGSRRVGFCFVVAVHITGNHSGVGLLSLFLGNPLLRPLYGSMSLLVIATVVTSMTLGVQIIKSSLIQLGVELEEAVKVAGGTDRDSSRDILLPILLRLCFWS